MTPAEQFELARNELLQEVRHLVFEFQDEWGLIPLSIDFKPIHSHDGSLDFLVDITTFTR